MLELDTIQYTLIPDYKLHFVIYQYKIEIENSGISKTKNYKLQQWNTEVQMKLTVKNALGEGAKCHVDIRCLITVNRLLITYQLSPIALKFTVKRSVK